MQTKLVLYRKWWLDSLGGAAHIRASLVFPCTLSFNFALFKESCKFLLFFPLTKKINK